MANDLIVQSSLSTLPKPTEIKQQETTKVGPALVVSGPQKSNAVQNNSEQHDATAELSEKVALLNAHMQNFNRLLQFRVDNDSGVPVVTVIDSETDQVLRQIPSQELLDIRQAAEKYRGILLETKV